LPFSKNSSKFYEIFTFFLTQKTPLLQKCDFSHKRPILL
jgi:hypothetical protein